MVAPLGTSDVAFAQSSESQLQQKLRQSNVQLADIVMQQKKLLKLIYNSHADVERSEEKAMQESAKLVEQYKQLANKGGVLENESRQQSAQLEGRKDSAQAKPTLLENYRTRLAAVRDDYETYQMLANEPTIWPYWIETKYSARPYGVPRKHVIRKTVRRYLSELKASGKKIDLDELTRRLKIEKDIADALRERIQNKSSTKMKWEIESLQKKIDALENPTAVAGVTAVTQNDTLNDAPYYASKCPEKNPGDAKNPDRLKYIFDTNNIPKDGEHVVCQYWKDGDLDREKPYKNYKEDGISYFYFTNKPHNLKFVRRRVDGEKDGPQTDFNQTTEGKHYKFIESEYILGEVQQYTRYREDGSIHYVNTYSGGKKIRGCVYPDDGGAVRCNDY